MVDLEEMQFEILTSEDNDTGVPFGIGHAISVDDAGFDPGEMSWLTQDSENPHTGARLFGRDTTAAAVWSWALHVNQTDTETALEALRALRRAWKGRQVASRPGEVLPLRYRIGGRTRRVYGRPRRFAAPPDNRIVSGYVPITAQFDCVDDLHYDDVEQSAALNFEFDTDGGFILPAVLPIQTIPQSEREIAVFNGGDEPTNPVIRFNGPVNNPSLTGPGWTVKVDVDLVEGEYVEVDTRPWKLTAIRNGSAGVGGRLGKRQYLPDVVLHPGVNTLRYAGSSTTSSSICTVHWRSAHSSL